MTRRIEQVAEEFFEQAKPTPDAVGYAGVPAGLGYPGEVVDGYVYDIPSKPGYQYVRTALGVELEVGEAIIAGVRRNPNRKLDFYREGPVLVTKSPNAISAVAGDGEDVEANYVPELALIRIPGSESRNLIEPSGDYPALVIRNHADQTVSPLQLQTSAGAVLVDFSADGKFSAVGINSTPIGADTPSTGAFTTLTATTSLDVEGHAAFGVGQSVLATQIVAISEAFGNLTTTTVGLRVAPTATLTGNNSNVLAGMIAAPTIDQNGFNLTAAQGLRAFSFSATAIGASGTVTAVIGGYGQVINNGAGTINIAAPLYVNSTANLAGGAVTYNTGLLVRTLSAGTNNAYIVIDPTSGTPPTGNWGVYVNSSNDNAFAGKASFGKVSAPGAALDALLSDSATNTVVNVGILGHNGGTAAAGFGGGLALNLESSTTNDQNAALIEWIWQTATHASRSADLVLSAYNTSNKREGVRIRGGAAGAQLGFYGVTPIARAVLATGAGATVDNVITALQNLGLVSQT